MEQRTYRTWLWTLALLGLLVDQASKYGAFSWLRDQPEYRYTVVEGVFDFVAHHKAGPDGTIVPHVNQGALFGLAQQFQGSANMVFAIISFLAAVLIIVWSIPKSTAKDGALCVALGLILGGTLGNLYDRLFFGGVRDFLDWRYLYDWPVFNIADCCLVIGAGMLLIQAFRAQPQTEEQSTNTSDYAEKTAVAAH